MDFDIVPLHYGSTRVDTGYRRVIPKKKMASWNLAFFGCKLYLHVPSIYCITRVLRRTGCCTCCVPVSVGDAELGENHSSRRRLDMNHPPTHTPCPPWNRCNISWCRHSRHFTSTTAQNMVQNPPLPCFEEKQTLLLIRSNGRRPRPRMIVVVVVTAIVVTVFVGSSVGCRAPETFSTQYLLLLLLLL